MPSFEVARGKLHAQDVEAIALPALAAPELSDEEAERETVPPAPILGPGAQDVSQALDVDLDAELRALRFDGAVGSVARIPTRGALPAALVLVVGAGKATELDADVVRRAGAALADATARMRSVAATVPAGGDDLAPADAAQAFVEGYDLGAYRYLRHKSNGQPHRVDVVRLVASPEVRSPSLRRGVDRGSRFAAGARRARDLVNEPPAAKRPPAFAERVRAELHGSGVQVRVLDEAALQEGGYGGMLAVGQGSDAPPRLVELSYDPAGARRHVALVGKGITFDSGGLSIKPAQSMMTMKMDMGGAAAVMATVAAAAELRLPVRLTGVMALAENMPSAHAQRPGDVYVARNGKTVEVLNTDAEGRLVLSDALAHASERDPDAIVDVATLTGAVIVALGNRIGGLMASHDGLADGLLAAGELSGERLWRLPLPDDYRDHLKSEVADLKNIGKQGVAGTVVAALFLREFVGDGIPWAHLDIAGLAWADEPYGYVRKGGTGAPVRTLLHWLADGARI